MLFLDSSDFIADLMANGSFMCNILFSNFPARGAILMQSDDGQLVLSNQQCWLVILCQSQNTVKYVCYCIGQWGLLQLFTSLITLHSNPETMLINTTTNEAANLAKHKIRSLTKLLWLVLLHNFAFWPIQLVCLTLHLLNFSAAQYSLKSPRGTREVSTQRSLKCVLCVPQKKKESLTVLKQNECE